MKNSLLTNSVKQLQGTLNIPADKSISHRALILSGMATGCSVITNLLESEDVICTLNTLKYLGVAISLEQSQQKNSSYKYIINSSGFKELNLNNKKIMNLYMGNSGTSCRLLTGILAGLQGNFIIHGDASLSQRPMARIIQPLMAMGANISSINQHLPLHIQGSKLHGISYQQIVASAQVKSCIMLASLFAEGETTIEEFIPTRDHTENMLKLLGVDIKKEKIRKAKQLQSTIFYLNNNSKDILAYNYTIPADFSSASFFIALALISENAKITLPAININPLRAGLLKYLKKMGANIQLDNIQYWQGEAVADIIVKSSLLQAIDVMAEDVATLIDELPILFILAANTDGVSNFYDIQELRYKESDRLAVMAKNLHKLGVKVVEKKDSLQVHGSRKLKTGGIKIDSYQDHRIAMSFVIMGSKCQAPIEILNTECINTSFPNFINLCQQVGYAITCLNN